MSPRTRKLVVGSLKAQRSYREMEVSLVSGRLSMALGCEALLVLKAPQCCCPLHLAGWVCLLSLPSLSDQSLSEISLLLCDGNSQVVFA